MLTPTSKAYAPLHSQKIYMLTGTKITAKANASASSGIVTPSTIQHVCCKQTHTPLLSRITKPIPIQREFRNRAASTLTQTGAAGWGNRTFWSLRQLNTVMRRLWFSQPLFLFRKQAKWPGSFIESHICLLGTPAYTVQIPLLQERPN